MLNTKEQLIYLIQALPENELSELGHEIQSLGLALADNHSANDIAASIVDLNVNTIYWFKMVLSIMRQTGYSGQIGPLE